MLKARVNKKNRKNDTHVIKEKNNIYIYIYIYLIWKNYIKLLQQKIIIILFYSHLIFMRIFFFYKLCILGSHIIIHKVIFNIILKN
jgi:hypothetical protein